MIKLKSLLKHFDLQEWTLLLTALTAILIGLLDFTGLLPENPPLLSRMTIVALGLLMTVVVFQSKSQEVAAAQLIDALIKSLHGQIVVEEFNTMESGVEYLASRVLIAQDSIDQASLSAPLNRWNKANTRFESAIREAALRNGATIRYIANFADQVRAKRVRDIIGNPAVQKFTVKSFKHRSLVHPLNFSIFDGKEIVLSVPAGVGKEDTFIAVRNEQLVAAFTHYFDLLWDKATLINKAKFQDLEDNGE